MSWNNKEEIETTCTVRQWRFEEPVLTAANSNIQLIPSSKEVIAVFSHEEEIPLILFLW